MIEWYIILFVQLASKAPRPLPRWAVSRADIARSPSCPETAPRKPRMRGIEQRDICYKLLLLWYIKNVYIYTYIFFLLWYIVWKYISFTFAMKQLKCGRNHWPRCRTLTATVYWACSIHSAPRTPVRDHAPSRSFLQNLMKLWNVIKIHTCIKDYI